MFDRARFSSAAAIVAVTCAGLSAPASGAPQDQATSDQVITHATSLIKAKKWADGLAFLTTNAAKIVADDKWVWHAYVATCHASLGDSAKMLAEYQAAIKLQPKGWAGELLSRDIITVADVLMEKGELKNAIDFLGAHGDKILKDDQFVYFGRQGVCWDLLRNSEKALEFYNKAISHKPDSWYRSYRAKIFHTLGKWDEARKDLDADADLIKEEKEARRLAPLRVVVDGPFRRLYPNSWRKYEQRSKIGNFHIVSTAGIDSDGMDDVEERCAGLDAEKRKDQKKLKKLLRPMKQLESIAAIMELMRKEYMKTVNMKEKDWPKDRVFKVFYFEDKSEFELFNTLQGNPDSESMLGYYQPGYKFLALYNAPGGDQVHGLSEETLDTFFHEGWHQFYDLIAAKPPIWVNEGLAEVMGPSKILNGGKKINLAPLVKKRSPEYPTRYETITAAVKRGQHFKWRKFFRVDRKAWNEGDTNLMYAQAWAVCYFALRGPHKGFRDDFLKLFWGTTKGKSQKALIDELFPNDKLDSYEKIWVKYMKKL
jgi:tetratricopeptide (TPR) repeat protein